MTISAVRSYLPPPRTAVGLRPSLFQGLNRNKKIWTLRGLALFHLKQTRAAKFFVDAARTTIFSAHPSSCDKHPDLIVADGLRDR